MTHAPETVVPVLLAAAGLVVPAAELAELVALYPAHRAALDALFAVPMTHEEVPALRFLPLA